MKILKVIPRGYCKGVIRAINIAKETAMKYPNQQIYVLGMLVHNQYVMKALELLNIHAIDDSKRKRIDLLDDIHEGVVIFTAHGISEDVVQKAKAKGLICIDASCPDVKQTQKIVKAYLEKDYEVLYIGKKHHPEAEAICSIDKKRIHLITSFDDIPVLEHTNIFVTNQTTMSIFDIDSLFQFIHQKYPNAVFSEEICNATRIRQEAIAALKDQQVDCLFVVGDQKSNNSHRLAQIAKENQIAHVYLIDTVFDIDETILHDFQTIAVTAGASTPTYLTNQVISYLEEFAKNKHAEKPLIDMSKVL